MKHTAITLDQSTDLEGSSYFASEIPLGFANLTITGVFNVSIEMNTFSALLSLCGLSQAEAAEILSVRPDTVHKWVAGTTTPPEGIWYELATIAANTLDIGTRGEGKLPEKPTPDMRLPNPDGLPDGLVAMATAIAFILSLRQNLRP